MTEPTIRLRASPDGRGLTASVESAGDVSSEASFSLPGEKGGSAYLEAGIPCDAAILIRRSAISNAELSRPEWRIC
jgi:hypothetical protein